METKDSSFEVAAAVVVPSGEAAAVPLPDYHLLQLADLPVTYMAESPKLEVFQNFLECVIN